MKGFFKKKWNFHAFLNSIFTINSYYFLPQFFNYFLQQINKMWHFNKWRQLFAVKIIKKCFQRIFNYSMYTHIYNIPKKILNFISSNCTPCFFQLLHKYCCSNSVFLLIVLFHRLIIQRKYVF